MTPAATDPATLIARLGGSARASLASVAGGLGFFAVTPTAPYDPALSTAEQARQTFAKADARLAEIGSSRGALAFCAILLADMDDVAAFNAEWDGWVADVAPPARACFQARLANPALKVELIIVCAVSAT